MQTNRDSVDMSTSLGYAMPVENDVGNATDKNAGIFSLIRMC